jgi:hypothetical protein
VIAQALALDRTGEYRERLVQKLNEVVGLLAVRNQQEYLLLINLVSKYAKKDKARTEPEVGEQELPSDETIVSSGTPNPEKD